MSPLCFIFKFLVHIKKQCIQNRKSYLLSLPLAPVQTFFSLTGLHLCACVWRMSPSKSTQSWNVLNVHIKEDYTKTDILRWLEKANVEPWKASVKCLRFGYFRGQDWTVLFPGSPKAWPGLPQALQHTSCPHLLLCPRFCLPGELLHACECEGCPNLEWWGWRKWLLFFLLSSHILS